MGLLVSGENPDLAQDFSEIEESLQFLSVYLLNPYFFSILFCVWVLFLHKSKHMPLTSSNTNRTLHFHSQSNMLRDSQRQMGPKL